MQPPMVPLIQLSFTSPDQTPMQPPMQQPIWRFKVAASTVATDRLTLVAHMAMSTPRGSGRILGQDPLMALVPTGQRLITATGLANPLLDPSYSLGPTFQGPPLALVPSRPRRRTSLGSFILPTSLSLSPSMNLSYEEPPLALVPSGQMLPPPMGSVCTPMDPWPRLGASPQSSLLLLGPGGERLVISVGAFTTLMGPSPPLRRPSPLLRPSPQGSLVALISSGLRPARSTSLVHLPLEPPLLLGPPSRAPVVPLLPPGQRFELGLPLPSPARCVSPSPCMLPLSFCVCCCLLCNIMCLCCPTIPHMVSVDADRDTMLLQLQLQLDMLKL